MCIINVFKGLKTKLRISAENWNLLENNQMEILEIGKYSNKT